MSDQPSADPEDLQFGSAAAKKQEMLDQALREGANPERLDDEPEDLRPGGKAEPEGSLGSARTTQ